MAVPTVSIEQVPARRLAVASATIPRRELASTIRRLLDHVWPALRSQHVTTGHNIVVYHPPVNGLMQIEAGVEIFGEFAATGVVYESATPSGRVATVTHLGPYDQMQPAYAALDEWVRSHDQPDSQVSWEIYGDWTDDPSQLRTDIYYLLS